MKPWVAAWLAIAFAAISSTVAADDVIRCSGGLVRRGMAAFEVVAKCGEPERKEVENVPVHARRGKGTAVVGTTRIERWTYDRGAGQFPALLTFEEDKLKSVELLTRR
jgi:hypothetical protein